MSAILLEAASEVTKEAVAKVPIGEFIQANPLVAAIIGFCMVVSIIAVTKKGRRY